MKEKFLLPLLMSAMGAAFAMFLLTNNRLYLMLFVPLNLILAIKYNKYYLLLFLAYAAFNFYYAYLAPLGSWKQTFLQKIIKDLFVSFIYIVWLFEVIAKKKKTLLYSVAALPIVLYLCLAFLALIRTVGVNTYLGFAGFRNMAIYIPMFFVSSYYINSKKDIQKVVNVLFSVGVVVALLGIYEFFFSPLSAQLGRHELFLGHFFRRIYSTMLYPGSLALFLVLLILLLLSFHFSRIYLVNKRISYIILSVLLACLFLTYARGGLIAFVIGSGYLLLRHKRYKTILSCFLVLASMSVALYFLAPSTIWRYVRFFEEFTTEQSITMRASKWVLPFELMQNHPAILFTGIGIDKVGNVVSASRFVTASTSYSFIQTDNYYLQLLIGTGALGVVFLIWILVSLFKEASYAFCYARDEYLKAIIWGLQAIILAFAFYGVVGSLWESFPLNMYFWVLMGLIPVIKYLSSQKEQIIVGNEKA